MRKLESNKARLQESENNVKNFAPSGLHFRRPSYEVNFPNDSRPTDFSRLLFFPYIQSKIIIIDTHPEVE